jgi:cysteine-rich repeat protein
LIIGACHSGETRDPLAVDPGDTPPDSGSDAAVPNGFSGSSGASGTGGNAGHFTSGNGGADASGTAGVDAGENNAGSGGRGPDIPDASAGDAAADGDAAPTCGDGNIDLELDEECDDGNQQHSDGCEFDCKTTRVTQVALGVNFMCALSSGGGVKCWGKDVYGVLGRATSSMNVPDPSQIGIIDFGTSRRVTQISASWYHACALFEDGHARCWGHNDGYQLGTGNALDYGDGSDEELRNLGDLPLGNIRSIAASHFSTCVISGESGTDKLYCWGTNSRGELGVGNTAPRTSPNDNYPAVLGATPLQVVPGYRGVCSLLGDGSVRCQGSNTFGRLGVGAINHYIGNGIGDGNGVGEFPNDPALSAKGLPGPASALLSDYLATCALVQGEAYCWGSNSAGIVGHPGIGAEVWQTPGPVNLGDVSVVQAAVGPSHGCGLDAQGTVRCWGGGCTGCGIIGYPGVNNVGLEREPELDYLIMSGRADGGTPDAAIPGAADLPLGAVDVGDFDGIPGLDPVDSIWAGYRASCAIMKNGGLRCWGLNTDSRLGYGLAVPNIGYAKSPGDTYADLGFSDVNVFGPPPQVDP